MEKGEIFAAVRTAISEMLGKPEGEITPNTTIIDGLGMDYLQFKHVTFILEDRFGIKISTNEDQFGGISTVGHIVDLLEPLL